MASSTRRAIPLPCTLAIAAGCSDDLAISDGGSSSESPSASETGAGTEGTGGETGEPPTCGDGVVDPGEDCDDANAIEWDGCSSACVSGYVPDPVTLGLDLPGVVPVVRIDVAGQAIDNGTCPRATRVQTDRGVSPGLPPDGAVDERQRMTQPRYVAVTA